VDNPELRERMRELLDRILEYCEVCSTEDVDLTSAADS
jgi:hypothetical protein